MSDRDMQRGNCDAPEHFEVKGESHYYDEEFCVNFRPLPTPPVDAPPAASPMTILTNALHDPRWNEQSTKDAREIAERARVEVDAYNRKDRAPAPAAPSASREIILDTVRSVLDQLKPENDCDSVLEKEAAEAHIREMLSPAAPPAVDYEHDVYCGCSDCVKWKNSVLRDEAPAAPPQDVQAAIVTVEMLQEAEPFTNSETTDAQYWAEYTERLNALIAAERPAPAQAERQVASGDEETLLREGYCNDTCSSQLGDYPCDCWKAKLRAIIHQRPSERVSAEELAKLKMKWRELSEQAGPQGCLGRAAKVANIAFEVGKEVYAKCADELEAILRPTHTPESGGK